MHRPPAAPTHRLKTLVVTLSITLLIGMAAPAALAVAPLLPQTQTSGPEAIVTADVLNLRGGPGTGYTILGRLANGQHVGLIGKSEDGKWWQVDTGKAQGWVIRDHVLTTGRLADLPVVKAPPLPKRAATQPPAGHVASAAATVAAPAPTPTGFFGYGIQIDPTDWRNAAPAVLGLNGFRWVKFQLPWKDFEGAGPGQRNWPDDVVDGIGAQGLQILASIVKSPNWARPGNTDLAVEGPPADPATYASFVGEFAGRYCGRVQAIEVWNEQNLHREWGNESLDAARYVRLLAAAYRAIKGACPSMIVVSGAPTPTGENPPVAIRDTLYLEQMYRAGLKHYCDAVGAHPSGHGNPPDARFQDWQAGNFSRPSHVGDPSFYFRNTMEQYRNIMVKYGDGNKRIWPTEFGWASTGSPLPSYEYAQYNSDEQQGQYIVRAYEIMRNWGFVGPAFLWNLNYNKTQPTTELAAFGIQDRPAYWMLAAMPK